MSYTRNNERQDGIGEREELGRRGDEIYERDILPRLSLEDQGKIAAIDVETGDYEIAGEELAAADRLLTRRPKARIWLRRIGSRYLYRFGAAGVAIHELPLS